MTTPSERIRAMVKGGRVAEAEGERLLRALEAPGAGAGLHGGSGVRLLVDPFARWGGGMALVPSLLFVIAGLAIARLGVHFDGFLDLHVGAAAGAPWVNAVEQLVAWPLGAAVLWAVGRSLGGPGRRFVDFLGAVGVARGPVVLFALPLQLLAPSSLGGHVTRLSPALLVVALVAIVCIAWQVALLFFGYRNASGLRGPKLGFSFASAVLLAEIVSKVVLFFALR